MSPSRRLDPLLRHAQDREDEVAKALAERQKTLEMHQSRLSELRQYADEYANAQMAATSASQLMNRRAFLDRLDNAVQTQSKTVDSNREHVDAERARLLLASRDKQVLEQLAASYRAQEKQVAERRDQREMDDLGARRARLAKRTDDGEPA
ncbi:flagellar export protein FliJ [Stenotrophomonas pictorum JCM 9942]|jgi:flagellar FliJ protein|uniref:Flagellar FliJ protein n=1 Tax=Stenotrophomonas pictorum JCM 9942 TaxID=1236960 RepID=A0A0R0A302_9GAMM|nr:flagellar export protein FliJ [Stenotrophomonas pictorum]KRG39453.1 flagellar export protein FliJ [Stenotrophomonas pictorum JCM 9942]